MLAFIIILLFIHMVHCDYPMAKSANNVHLYRSGSAAFTANGTVYIHGGSTIASNSNQLFSISFDEYGFLHYQNVSDQGPAVSYHQAIVLPGNNSVVFFGGLGYSIPKNNGSQTMHAEIYSFSQNTWNTLPGMDGTTVPLHREGHTAVIASNELIYIQGGAPGPENSNILVDSWVYNPKTLIFTNLSTPPVGLYGSSAIALSDGRIIYIGGRYSTENNQYISSFLLDRSMIYYTDSDIWMEQELNIQAIHVINRFNDSRVHGSAVLGPDGRYIYYFGGMNGNDGNGNDLYYNNVLILDTQTWTWNAPGIPGIKPNHRCLTIGAGINNEYILFGYDINKANTTSTGVDILKLPETKKSIGNNSTELDFESLKWVYNITTGETCHQQRYPDEKLPSSITKSFIIVLEIICGIVLLALIHRTIAILWHRRSYSISIQ
ncbi:hypothetical protein BDA99DRAFT_493766 [Phascolomyces articulosus]|uniref:Attractin/MKLN-like beta-propeller domain-containing protein n=1 Tax=Phascolomyces articulosus TaxID=60185 RepID=A0AAD5PJB6_9FUNG|nr:hypothetical protein BDA99DRAFT_493766 [Phascolomyces articulosus]